MAVLGAITRPVLLATRALQWSSAVIAMGIFSYFVHQNSHGTHLIYNEVISVISVVFFLPAFISPFMPNILSKFVVLIDMVFSYLWLTSFIFTSQDYDFGSCTFANPAGVACSKKKAAQAFTFLTFIFTVFGFFVELLAMWTARNETAPIHEKHDGGRAPVDAPVATV